MILYYKACLEREGFLSSQGVQASSQEPKFSALSAQQCARDNCVKSPRRYPKTRHLCQGGNAIAQAEGPLPANQAELRSYRQQEKCK